MALDLDLLAAGRSLPAGLEIQAVEETAALKTWIDIFVEGYPIPESMKAPLLTLLVDLGLGLPLRHYLGLLDGVPVATSTLYLGAGVAQD